jgi:hypothetical protein
MSTQEQSIETIGYVSPLYRRELIAICGIRRQGEQVEEAAGKSLEKLVENTVRFHKGLKERVMGSVYHPDPNRELSHRQNLRSSLLYS